MQRVRKAFGTDFPQHKIAKLQESDAGDTLKVIGAGLPRTGTSSLKAALEILGFDPCHYMVECCEKPTHSILFASLIQTKPNPNATPTEVAHSAAAVKKALRNYGVAVDAPTCEVYAELLALFPNAKVVLSVRDSEEQWWKSFSDTIGAQLGVLYPTLIYPVGFLLEQQKLMWVFKKQWANLTGGPIGPVTAAAHRRKVKENVPKEKLLNFNVKEGWSRLCEFLDVELPDVPFPNL
ncbi:MAG: hypothetical protein Q9199_000652 [Rusavskia elegans]